MFSKYSSSKSCLTVNIKARKSKDSTSQSNFEPIRHLPTFSTPASVTMSNKQDAFVCILNPTSLPSLSASDAEIGGLDVKRLWTSARTAGANKALESRVVYGASGEVAALVSVGNLDKEATTNAERREVVRKAAGKGVNLLKDLGAASLTNVGVALVGVEEDAHAAGENGDDTLFNFQTAHLSL